MSEENENISKKHQNELSELNKRIRIGECSKHRTTFQNKLGTLEKKYKDLNEDYIRCMRDITDSLNANFRKRTKLEDVLRDHLKSHIVVARDQLTNKDKIIIFREFDKAIEDQLKKLDVGSASARESLDRQTEKKEVDYEKWHKEMEEKYPEINKEIYKDSGGSELIRNSKLLEKLDEKGVEMETILQTEPEKEDIVINKRTTGAWVKELLEKQKKELIEMFLKRFDWVMERVEFHTENPDSELMDELSEEYKEWQGGLNERS